MEVIRYQVFKFMRTSLSTHENEWKERRKAREQEDKGRRANTSGSGDAAITACDGGSCEIRNRETRLFDIKGQLIRRSKGTLL